MSRMRGVLWGSGQYADTPVNEDMPPEWADTQLVQESDVAKQIQDTGDPPPNILTPFAKKIGPVYSQPSDIVNTQTYFLVGGARPVAIVNPQDKGMACRVTLINLGDGAGSGKVLIATVAEYLTGSTNGIGQGNAFSLPAPAAAGYPA